MKELIFINEITYQQIKNEMCKTNNYFTKEELENIRRKIDVNLT